MRLYLLSIACTLLLTVSLVNSFAQTTVGVQTSTAAPATIKQRVYKVRDTIKNTDQTLSGQYRFILSRSRTSPEGYKIIVPSRLTQLFKNVNDTIKKEKAERAGLQQKLTEQVKTIAYLKTEISAKENALNSYTDKLNEISFLGIGFDKSTYNTIVWGIIMLLVIALIIVVAMSSRKISEGKHRSQLYDEISEEYQTYKSKTVEKERKLARELQDERNKLADLFKNR